MIDADRREATAVELLLAWPGNLSGVLIGGYAVAAYGTPRYSEDLDVVARAADLPLWRAWLEGAGLRLENAYTDRARVDPPLGVDRWARDPLSVDLMFGGVRDRVSGGIIPETWLLHRPEPTRLELLSGRVEHPVPVVSLEGLWATKLLASRGQDVADLFSTSQRQVSLPQVRAVFVEIMQPALEKKLEATLRLMSDRRTYVDTLSRLGLGSPKLEANIRRWQRFASMVRQAIPELQ